MMPERVWHQRPVRVGVKAVILENGRVLATKNVEGDEVFYLMPGGGQEPGEPLHTALCRECREEIGTEVEVDDLLCVRDYIPRAGDSGNLRHQLELYFSCRLPDGATLGNGTIPDTYQVGIEWLDLATLEERNLYPVALRGFLRAPLEHRGVYLGDVD